MNRLKKPLQILLTLVAATQLTACSKTVQWEEEVPLNTGETIWVTRTDSYVKGGEPGNPLKMTWGIEKRALEFTWRGQKYTFHTDTTEILMLYELDTPKDMAIVAWTKDCEKRGYGEFRWRNGSWQLQQRVSQSLIGQPRNLMSYYSAEDGAIPARVTKDIRNAEDTHSRHGADALKLETSRIATNCSGSK